MPVYLKVVEELSEGHLLPTGLQTFHFKAVPKRPVNFIILPGEEQI